MDILSNTIKMITIIPNISVIIPIYNSSRHLKQCIRSVLNQTYKNIEIILINDASTDKSKDICLSFKKKDKRIRYVEKTKNEGVDKARFLGIELANGNFIFFLDADDWLEPFALSLLYDNAIKSNADYVEIGYRKVYDSYKLLNVSMKKTILGLIEQPELFDDYYLSFFGKYILSYFVHGKLFKKNIFYKFKFTPSGFSYGEDVIFLLNLFPHLNSILILDEIGYNYRYGGMSTKYNPKIFEDLKQQFHYKLSLINKFKYDKAIESLLYELKEICKSEIIQMINFAKCTKPELISYLSQEKYKFYYQILLQNKNISSLWSCNFLNMIHNNSFSEIYTEYIGIFKHKKIKEFLKYCLSYL